MHFQDEKITAQVLEAFANLGIEEELEIGQLEQLLSNSNEPVARKERTLRVLKVIRDNAADSTIRREAIRVLAAHQGPLPRLRKEQQPWRVLQHVSDPRWKEVIADVLADRDVLRRQTFARHVEDILLGFSLVDADSRSRTAALWLFTEVEDLVGTARLGSKVLQLRRLSYSDQLETSLPTLHDLSASKQWTELTSGLDAVEQTVAGARAIDVDVTAFEGLRAGLMARGRWHKQYQSLISRLEALRGQDDRQLPWGPQIESTLLGVVKSVHQYATETELSKLTESFVDLDRYVAQSLQHRILREQCSLESAKEVVETWMTLLATWPPTATQEVLRSFQAKQDEEVSRYIAAFQARYDGEELLQSPVRRASLSADTKVLWSSVERDIDVLKSIRRDLVSWENIGLPPENASALDRVVQRLERTQTHWAKSPYHHRLTEQLEAFKHHWATLNEAQEAFHREQLDAALALAKGVPISSARRLEDTIIQAQKEKALNGALEDGTYEGMARRDFERASEHVVDAYRKTEQGRRFVDRLQADEQRAESAPLPELQELLHQSSSVPFGAKLSGPDENRFRGLQESIGRKFNNRLEADIDAVIAEAGAFRPLKDGRLQDLNTAMQALASALESADAKEWLSVKQGQAIDILRVHNLCDAGKWNEARGVTKTLERPSIQQQLRARIAIAELAARGASDQQWLDTFLAHSRVVLDGRNTSHRRHYLELLRRNVDMPAFEQHLEQIAQAFDSSSFLASVMRFRLEPQQGFSCAQPPLSGDLEMLGRVIKQLIEEVIEGSVLTDLWQQLPQDMKALAWPYSDTPLHRYQAMLDERVSEFTTAVHQSEADFSALLRDFNGLEDKVGSPLDVQMKRELTRAAEAQGEMAELASNPPWRESARGYVESAQRLLDGLPKDIPAVAHWVEVLGSHKKGYQAWQDIKNAWDTFTSDFDSKHLRFHLEPTDWQVIVRFLENWCTTLRQRVARIDWTLERAEQSPGWLALLSDWQSRAEGRSWMQVHRSAPRSPDELLNCYEAVLVQVADVFELHTSLLEMVQQRGPSPQTVSRRESGFQSLRDMQPLCNPVSRIRADLMDAQVSEVGRMYQSWVASQETHT